MISCKIHLKNLTSNQRPISHAILALNPIANQIIFNNGFIPDLGSNHMRVHNFNYALSKHSREKNASNHLLIFK